MKSGAGDDPFADDPFEESDGDREDDSEPVDDDGESSERRPSTDGAADGSRRDGEPGAEVRDPSPDDTAPSDEPSDGGGSPAVDSTDNESTAEGATDEESMDIPWVLRRSRVKEDRNNVHQFFLRDEYSKAEDDIMAAVAEKLDIREKRLKKLDVREAMVATADAEAVADTLEEWGYEYVD
jgi:hypothetical protein